MSMGSVETRMREKYVGSSLSFWIVNGVCDSPVDIGIDGAHEVRQVALGEAIEECLYV